MKRKATISFLLVGTIACLLLLVDDAVIRFLLLFGVASLVLSVLLFTLVFLLASRIVRGLLPHGLRGFCEVHNARFRLVFLFCLLILTVIGWPINHYWLPSRYHPVSVVMNTGLVALMLLLGWLLLMPTSTKAMMLVTGVAVYILIVLAVRSSHVGSVITGHSSIEALKTLGYLNWAPSEASSERAGVTRYDRQRSNEGLNLYASRELSKAFLIDMSGNVVHEWRTEARRGDRWEHAEMCENGDLLVTLYGSGKLLRLDKNSNIKWTMEDHLYHHDIDVAENGDMYVLARKDDLVSLHGLPVVITNDYIVVISSANEINKEVSLFDVFRDQIPVDRLFRIYRYLLSPNVLKQLLAEKRDPPYVFRSGGAVDVMHSNTIEILNHNVNDVFRKGNILYCSRALDLIAVIDPVEEDLLWLWGPGELERPHDPTQLESGNVLVFDNGSVRHYSRVLELNPITNEVVWEYVADPKEEFFTDTKGASQRLPNGNTLITEADKGRVFEVTREGDIVWEFYNPETRDFAGVHGRAPITRRATIYRMMRVTDRRKYRFLRSE